ncbi:MAG: tRNA (N(6)-L-threonylcarbamoyladenosine(37)-C(2))-methylthiotransferase MtaB [Lachnospiraceae bacterium]|nr:tRNA (N(6)-L-threonylcarbamoyladenosine(37)-C(2))-methylthiotransferase MtaB [Lachnospiraceae bacterium]
MKKVSFHTLGCKVNAYETEAMQQRMEEAGYTVVPFGDDSDVCIINTCTVTNIADRKSRQMIHRAKKANPEAVIVAVGCYVESGLKDCEKDEAIDIVVGNNRKAEIVSIVENYIEEKNEAKRKLLKTNMSDMSAKSVDYEDMPLTRVENHTRAYIKIQDGCNQFCTYCIIPYTRGRIRSRDKASVIGEVTRLAKEGYKEIVLTGIHLSSYGKDLNNGESLLTILQSLNEIDGVERIRLGSLEPRIITEEFLDAISKLDKVCPHFHLSLQSGSEGVLKRMNRHYTPDEYYEKCELIRKYYPDAALTTDIIAGFPQETDEEWKETVAFAKKVNFFEIHVFKYSMRNGTRAAAMPGQVGENIKTIRSDELIEAASNMSGAFRERFIGRFAPVLFEEKITADNGREYFVGHTREYIKVALPAEEVKDDISGAILMVNLKILFGDMIEAKLV